MAENLYVNKLVVGNEVKFDLTSDTVTTEKLLSGYTAHDQSGAPITGTCDYDVNSQDATAQVAEVLNTKTFYARGSKLTGTMPNNGSVSSSITTKAQEVSIAQGYHDGSGKVSIDSTERAKIVAADMKDGVEILGVTGTYTGEGGTSQAKTVTPTLSVQTVLPDEGIDFLSQVTVNAIPVVETDNAAGGKTVTIG